MNDAQKLLSLYNKLAEEVVLHVKYGLQWGLKPMIAVVLPDDNPDKACGFMVLYCATASSWVGGKLQVDMTPLFYPYAVASILQRSGVMFEGSTTRKTGIDTIWYELTEEAVKQWAHVQ